jgi:hypothetical protein
VYGYQRTALDKEEGQRVRVHNFQGAKSLGLGFVSRLTVTDPWYFVFWGVSE